MKNSPSPSSRMRILPISRILLNNGGFASQAQMQSNKQLRKRGGKVKGKLTKTALKRDTIPAILQVGEIVIPRRISTQKKFQTYLKNEYRYDPKKGKFKE
jgi:hypothetical protein